MVVGNQCAKCRSPIPADAPHGFCPSCLLRTGLRALAFDIASPTPSKPKSTVGDYELLEEIARGGMGIVFRARQISLDRVVAVKALLFGEFASDPFIARFRAEAQAAAALQHPNIVAIHDVWEHRGQHFFSMEFVQGQTLAQILKEGPIASKRAARYAAVIARAAHFAHARGILHRDLKPSNVLIDQNDEPRITDFGLAKRLDRDSAQSTSGVVGSPHYMSPEQAGSRVTDLGPATDIYSIGAMLYHMLAGRPPFAGESVEEILSQTLNAEPVSPRLLNTSVTRDLETICLKCLQKDPRRRYASAQELADDLDRFTQDLPIQARPISRTERTLRWCRRNPAPTALLAIATLVAIISTWASIHFKHLNQTIRIAQYVSDMNVAIRNVEEGDNGHALALLKNHVPKGNNFDLRGFEWRHLWWLCRGNFETFLPKHQQVVGAITYTSDSKKVLTFAWDGTTRLWDAQTRRNLLTITNVASAGAFNPAETAILINRPDGALQWIDAKTGATNGVLSARGQLVAYSRESQVAAVISANSLVVLNVTSERELLSIPDPPSAKLKYGWRSPVSISPDGSTLALIKPSLNPMQPARSIRLWDIASGRELEELPENRELRCMTFSPDSAWLLSGDGQGSVRRWDLRTHDHFDITEAHKVPVLTIACSPDGRFFATGSSDRQPIRLWDLATGESKPAEFLGQAGDVWSLAFSSDSQRLGSGTRDGIIRIWNTNPPKIQSELTGLHSEEFSNIAFSPDSRLFAAGCTNSVKIWKVANLELVSTIPRANYVVAFSTDSRRVLVSNRAGDAFWWDIEKRTAERLPNYSNLARVVSVDISPDRRFAAVGLADGGIAVIDMTIGAPARPIFKGHTGAVQSIAFSPGGDKLASGGVDMNVMMWDVNTGASLGVCQEHKGAIYGLTISPNGKTLASGCGAETVKLWDVDHVNNHAWASASVHRSVVRSLSFSPDTRTLASGSEDRTVKLWNFAAFSQSTSRREVASFVFGAPIRAVQFAPDGNTLAAITDKGDLRLLRAYSLEECDRQLAELR